MANVAGPVLCELWNVRHCAQLKTHTPWGPARVLGTLTELSGTMVQHLPPLRMPLSPVGISNPSQDCWGCQVLLEVPNPQLPHQYIILEAYHS